MTHVTWSLLKISTYLFLLYPPETQTWLPIRRFKCDVCESSCTVTRTSWAVYWCSSYGGVANSMCTPLSKWRESLQGKNDPHIGHIPQIQIIILVELIEIMALLHTCTYVHMVIHQSESWWFDHWNLLSTSPSVCERDTECQISPITVRSVYKSLSCHRLVTVRRPFIQLIYISNVDVILWVKLTRYSDCVLIVTLCAQEFLFDECQVLYHMSTWCCLRITTHTMAVIAVAKDICLLSSVHHS